MLADNLGMVTSILTASILIDDIRALGTDRQPARIIVLIYDGQLRQLISAVPRINQDAFLSIGQITLPALLVAEQWPSRHSTNTLPEAG